MSVEEYTEQELAILTGEEIPEEEPISVGDLPPEPEHKASPPDVEDPEEPEPEEDTDGGPEFTQRVYDGLIGEIRNLRRSGQEDKKWRAGVEKNLELISEKMSGDGVEAEEEEPDRDADPVGWLEFKQRQFTEEKLKPIQEKADADEEQKQVRENFSSFVNETSAAESKYLADNQVDVQEYHGHLDELRKARADYYVSQGVTPKDAAGKVQEDEINFVLDCMDGGYDPTEEAIRLYGDYKKTLPEPEPVAEKPKKMGIVAAAKKGKKASNLSKGGGTASVISLEDFSAMDWEDNPIAKKIAGNPRKFAEITTTGQTTV